MPRKKKQAVTLSKPEVPAVPEKVYPDLSGVINQLEAQRPLANDASRPVIDKWLGQLKDLQQEMLRLEKLERFRGAINNAQNRVEGESDE